MTVSEIKAKIVATRMGIEMCVSRRLRSASSAATLRRARLMRHLLCSFVAARVIFTLLSFSSDSDNLRRLGPTTGPVTAKVVPSAAAAAAKRSLSLSLIMLHRRAAFFLSSPLRTSSALRAASASLAASACLASASLSSCSAAAAAEVSSKFDCEVGGSSGGEGGGEGTDAGAIREEDVRKRQQGACFVPWLLPALIWRIR